MKPKKELHPEVFEKSKGYKDQRYHNAVEETLKLIRKRPRKKQSAQKRRYHYEKPTENVQSPPKIPSPKSTDSEATDSDEPALPRGILRKKGMPTRVRTKLGAVSFRDSVDSYSPQGTLSLAPLALYRAPTTLTPPPLPTPSSNMASSVLVRFLAHSVDHVPRPTPDFDAVPPLAVPKPYRPIHVSRAPGLRRARLKREPIWSRVFLEMDRIIQRVPAPASQHRTPSPAIAIAPSTRTTYKGPVRPAGARDWRSLPAPVNRASVPRPARMDAGARFITFGLQNWE
ncbi:hypothetical protein J8273_5468 [Carpediemonas membranifera]|uniref:Uncharacterized protein n=1 Tax=Carpediemonas membranifera TaxID=201153 RepID=A0A8J6ARJ4_9EUKA|nr:hypothetical protein J8273_5468 [Carpediemonas membranifera]|eukprot:KAG9392476.1 hypothetical protein J8273_5468 [Carpediemonas membranifera]